MHSLFDYFLNVGMLTRPAAIAAVLLGLWFGLRRLTIDHGTQVRVWLSVAMPLVLWLALVTYLGQAGFFRARAGVPSLAIPLAIIIPALVGLTLLTRSKQIAAVMDAIPLSWLVGVQVYRIAGGVFIGHWVLGNVPAEFALPAGLGDVLVGILALIVALRLIAGSEGGRRMAYAWNLLGIADLIDAIVLGVITGPGRLHMLALDHPNLQTGIYPLVMIPAFGVPLSFILHGLSIWQLRRRSKAERTSMETSWIKGNALPNS